MNRRVLAAVIAVVLALAGGGLIYLYVHGADQRAMADLKPVNVLVATKVIPRGTDAAAVAKLTEVRQVPASAVVPGAVKAASELAGGTVATTDLMAGEQVLATRFADPAEQDMSAAVDIPKGMEQVSVQLDPQRVIGSDLKAGTTVGVIASFKFKPLAKEGESAEEVPTTHLMLERVLVTRVQGVAAATPGRSSASADSGQSPTLGGSQTSAPQSPSRRDPARLYERLPGAAATPQPADALGDLRARATAMLFERLGARLNDPELSEDDLRTMVVAELNRVVSDSQLPLTPAERKRLIGEIQDDVLGFGPLEPLLADRTITEVMVNGPANVYVEVAGRISQVPVRFEDEPHLRRVIDRIVTKVGRRIDESSPLVDARLADGSRVNAIIPPLAFSGSTLTIRKFSAEALTVSDLINLGTLSPEMAELLQACVLARLNVIISGGTGTGKTTLLNVLSSYIPENERIITIEDAVELKLQQEHLVRLESRPANIEGKGEVTIRDLVRNALRMRPDRIVVGEVRGAEALDMLQAMNTGHDGSLSTVHANSPRDALSRLETLVLMAGMDLPLRAIREQVASAVDVVVHLARLRDGTRRIVGINEVHGMEGQNVTMQDIFTFDYAAGVDANGRFLGRTIATGVRPLFVDRFHDLGITLPSRVFGGADVWTRR